MYTKEEAAKILGVSEYTVKDWINRSKLKVTSENNEEVISESDLNDFIKSTGIKFVKPEKPEDIFDEISSNKIIKVNNSDLIEDKIKNIEKKFKKENNTLDDSEIKKLFNEKNK